MNGKPIEDIYPLAPLQKSFFFHSRLDPASTAYLVQLFWKLEGPLDVEAFRRAWEEVFQRHAILRTDFAWKNLDEPLQVVHRRIPVDFARFDLPRDDEEQIEQLLLADRAQGIDLGRAPLARLRLGRVSDRLHYFLWSFHHILLDGWSLGILLREVFALYRSFRSGAEPDLPKAPAYRDYIAWLLDQRRRSNGEAFWRELLKGFHEPNRLARNRGPGSGSREIHLTIGAEAAGKLQSLARGRQLTLNTLLQGLWALVVRRESGDEDVVFGATVAGRPTELRGVENMVGLFINTLPLRVRVRREAPFFGWLAGIQEQALEVRRFEHIPPIEVLGASEVPRGVPLYESLLVFENYPLDPDVKRPADDLRIEDARYWSHTEIPLHLRVRPGDSWRLDLTYDRGAVDDERAESILAYLSAALGAVAERPDLSCADLLLLDADDHAGKTVAPLPPRADFARFEIEEASATIPDRFREIAAKHGDEVAIHGALRSFRYAELDQSSDAIAARIERLTSERARVALLLEHDAPMLIALLAAAKAGRPYVPLDPRFPPRRLRDILEDSRPELLVTNERNGELAREISPGGLPVLDLDRPGPLESARGPSRSLSPDALLYLLYTSGSTGQPKGVMQSHRNALDHVRAYTNALGIHRRDRLTLLSSFGFDAAVLDVFAALLNGAALCPYDLREQGFPRLGSFLREKRITVYHSTPTVFRAFAESSSPRDRFPSVRLVVLGGEEVVPADARSFARHFGEEARLLNLFGATEATLALLHPVSRDASSVVPLGLPVEGVSIWLLDPDDSKRLEGSERRRAARSGEIGIRSRSVALGYWNRPEETKERFLPGIEPGERIYRTGDLGRLRADGTLELIGRKEFLVKVRGQRVETGEVESALLESGLVAKCVVVAHSIEGQAALVAYVVGNEGPPVEIELRSFLRDRLPDAMIPQHFVFLPSLPMTPTGKVDRRALPPPPPAAAGAAPGAGPAALRSSTRERIAEIWRQVLRLGPKPIPPHVNFFDLGGHSLRLTQVASRLAEDLGVDVPLRDLFDHPTLESLSSRLESRFPDLLAPGLDGDAAGIAACKSPEGTEILETP